MASSLGHMYFRVLSFSAPAKLARKITKENTLVQTHDPHRFLTPDNLNATLIEHWLSRAVFPSRPFNIKPQIIGPVGLIGTQDTTA